MWRFLEGMFLSQLVALCAEPGCKTRFESSVAEFDSAPVCRERLRHLHTAHRGEGAYTLQQRWNWLWPSLGINVVAVLISAVAYLSPEGSHLNRLVVMLPQVAAAMDFPYATAGVIALVAFIAASATAQRREGTSLGRRLFAELNRVWLVITGVCFAIGFVAGRLAQSGAQVV